MFTSLCKGYSLTFAQSMNMADENCQNKQRKVLIFYRKKYKWYCANFTPGFWSQNCYNVQSCLRSVV